MFQSFSSFWEVRLKTTFLDSLQGKRNVTADKHAAYMYVPSEGGKKNQSAHLCNNNNTLRTWVFHEEDVLDLLVASLFKKHMLWFCLAWHQSLCRSFTVHCVFMQSWLPGRGRPGNVKMTPRKPSWMLSYRISTARVSVYSMSFMDAGPVLSFFYSIWLYKLLIRALWFHSGEQSCADEGEDQPAAEGHGQQRQHGASQAAHVCSGNELVGIFQWVH